MPTNPDLHHGLLGPLPRRGRAAGVSRWQRLVTIGKESAFDALTHMSEVGKALGDDPSAYENELAAKNKYRSTIRKKAALIVIDDVWRSSDLEPPRAEDSPRSRLLFSTRDASIAAAMLDPRLSSPTYGPSAGWILRSAQNLLPPNLQCANGVSDLGG